MSGASPPPPRGLIGFLDGLREGQVVVGWAADPQDRAARPILRLMRGLEVLAECRADVARDDGNPGFHLRAPAPLTPQDILEGRVRVRALLPGRQAATTLAMTRRMREMLEAAAGWEPTTLDPAPAPPPPAAPKVATPPAPRVSEVAPPPEAEAPPPRAPAQPPAPAQQDPVRSDPPPPAIRPAPEPTRHWTPAPAAPGWTPAPAAPAAAMPSSGPAGSATPLPAAATAAPAAPKSSPPMSSRPAVPVPEAAPPPPPPPLDAFLALARVATAAGVPALHLLVPRRATVLADEASPAWEQAAAARPLLAADWVPLRQAFAQQPNAGGYWREDGRSLSIDGCHALLLTLLKVLQARVPEASGALGRAASLARRADLAALPRRDIPPEPGASARPSFLGVAMRETEPDLSEAIFADRPAPRLIGEVMPGLEAWSAPSAPLPWRVVVLAAPGLGGSAGPARLGWWLRWLVAECVLSEALHIAAPEAALGPQPDLVLTLAPEP
ncbi:MULTISPECIES: hypothetical protein [Roseomonadaceae]|uniref:Uncharacterized protein n=1 Tax=Falsiroseomonas oleicola TaxID=2801474 RepID=A0ABS6HDW9_9PROT|nr:hypothetical protein [Roseomonas oleicola]MBU8546178.1 hypothetical protein [Roseomonas oleicola]